MKYLPLVLALLSSQALAIEWPWSEKEETRYGFCKGFVVGGLAKVTANDPSRTQLWLAWNYLNREEAAISNISPTDYELGRNRFEELLAAGNTQGLRDIAEDECGLGRN